MRYYLSITVAFLLLGAHNVYGILKPQQWGESEIPSAWHDALNDRIKDIASISNKNERIQGYLLFLEAVCNEKGLAPEQQVTLVAHVKEMIFNNLVTEVKNLPVSRDSCSSEFSQYVMSAARAVRDLSVDSQADLTQVGHRVRTLLGQGYEPRGRASNLQIPNAQTQGLSSVEYISMRNDKNKILSDIRATGGVALAVVGVAGVLFLAGYLFTKFNLASIERLQNKAYNPDGSVRYRSGPGVSQATVGTEDQE